MSHEIVDLMWYHWSSRSFYAWSIELGQCSVVPCVCFQYCWVTKLTFSHTSFSSTLTPQFSYWLVSYAHIGKNSRCNQTLKDYFYCTSIPYHIPNCAFWLGLCISLRCSYYIIFSFFLNCNSFLWSVDTFRQEVCKRLLRDNLLSVGLLLLHRGPELYWKFF